MSSDEDRASQISDMDLGPIEPTVPHLEHFKCKYDQTWDYPAIANSLFDGEQVLVQEEKVSTNHHVHFQGYTSLAPRTFGERMTELAATHYLKQKCPGSRPVKRARNGINIVGFQYLMKEGQRPLYQRGFTDEMLKELAAASQEHVKKLKSSAADILASDEPHITKIFSYVDDSKKMFCAARFAVGEAYRKEGRSISSRYFKDEVLNALLNAPALQGPEHKQIRANLYMLF